MQNIHNPTIIIIISMHKTYWTINKRFIMKKNNKLNTIVSVLIIVFLFAVAITIVIAGYNFIQEFSEIGKGNSAELLVVALKGLSTIAIGILFYYL